MIICRLLSQLAVPAFFFISGYFYFTKYHEHNPTTYKSKNRARLKSLVMPYIVWNAIFMIVSFLTDKILLQSTIADFLQENGGIRLFWDCGRDSISKNLLEVEMPKDRCPIDGPLWFMRDLIMLSLVSPLILFLSKYAGKIGLIVMAALMVLNIWFPFTFITSVGFFFFWLGAYFQINDVSIFSPNRRRRTLQHIAAIVVFLVAVMLYGRSETLDYYFYRIFTVVGIFSLFDFALLLVKKLNINPIEGISECSFFIYAAHLGSILMIVKKIVTALSLESYPVVEWILVSVLVVCTLTLAYYIFKNICLKCYLYLQAGDNIVINLHYAKDFSYNECLFRESGLD